MLRWKDIMRDTNSSIDILVTVDDGFMPFILVHTLEATRRENYALSVIEVISPNRECI